MSHVICCAGSVAHSGWIGRKCLSLAIYAVSASLALSQVSAQTAPSSALFADIGSPTEADTIVVTPDGKFLVSGDENGSIKVRDLTSGRLLRLMEADADIEQLIAMKDSRHVLSGSDSGRITLWDLTSGTEVSTFRNTDMTGLYGLAINPDETQVAASDYDTTILADLKSGTVVKRLEGHKDTVRSIAFSPDGKRLATSGDDETIALWDTADGSQLWSTKHSNGNAGMLQFSANGQEIIAMHEGKSGEALRVWNAANGQVLRTIVADKEGFSEPLITPDGKRFIAAASTNEPFRSWDITTGKAVNLPKKPAAAAAEDGSEPAKSWNSNWLVSPESPQLVQVMNDRIDWLDLDTGAPVRSVKILGWLEEDAASWIMSEDGRWLARPIERNAGQESASAAVFDLQSGQPAHIVSVGKWSLNHMRFSSGGARLAAVSDGTVYLIDVASGNVVWTITTVPEESESLKLRDENEWSLEDFALSPNERTLVVWGDKEARIYDTATGKVKRRMVSKTDVENVVFTADSKRVLIAEDSESYDKPAPPVRLVDVETGRTEGSFPASGSRIAISPDGQTLIIADRTLRVFDMATGALRLSFAGEPPCFAFAGNDALLMAAGTGLMSLDLKSGRPQQLSDTGGRPIADGCTISAAGQRLITEERDGGLGVRSLPHNRRLVRMFAKSADNWLTLADGAFVGQGDAVLALAALQDGRNLDDASLKSAFENPERVKAALNGAASDARLTSAADGEKAKSEPVAGSSFLGPEALPVAVRKLPPEDRPRIVANQGHASTPKELALSHDGSLMVTVAGERQAKVWDMKSSRLLRNLVLSEEEDMQAVALSPDTALAATGADTGRVTIFDVASGKPVTSFVAQQNVSALAWSQDGKWLVSGCGYRSSTDKPDKSTFKIFDTTTWKTTYSYEDKEFAVSDIKFLRDARHFVISSSSGLMIVDAETGALRREYAGSIGGGDAISISSDSELIAVTKGQGAAIFDVNTGLIRETEEGAGYTNGALFSKDTNIVYSTDSDGRVVGWDVKTGRVTSNVETGVKWLRMRAMVPGTESFLAIDGNTGLLTIRDIKTGALLRTFGEDVAQYSAVRFAPDGKLVSGGGLVELWDLVEASEVKKFDTGKEYAAEVRVTRDGKRLMTGHPRRLVQMLDVDSGQKISAAKDTMRPLTEKEKSDPIMSAVMSSQVDLDSRSFAFDLAPGGKQLALGRNDGSIKLFETSKGKLEREIKAGTMLTTLAYSPDGKLLMSGGADRKVNLWNPATGAQVRSFAGHKWTVRSAAFTPDGKRLLTGSGDKTIILWDMATGLPIKTIPAHSQVVRAAAFFPDGRHAVTGSYDATVKIWDTETAAELKLLQGHTGVVNSVAVSPNSRLIASASSDATLRIWMAETGELLVTMISAANGEWLIITPEGFFTASKNGANLLSVVNGGEVIGIDRFYDSLYSPDLVREKLAGDPTGKVKAAAAKLDLNRIVESGYVPKVAITSHDPQATSDNDSILVTASFTDAGGGIGRVEWRINDVVQAVADGGAPTGSKDYDSARAQTIALDPGDNKIEVIAYNGKNLIASQPARTTIKWTGTQPTAPPRLHVLAAGINDYAMGRLKLGLATADATAITQAFAEAGADKSTYESVHVTRLLNSDVTADGLEKAFADLATRIRTRDVFVFFIAGHGVTIDRRYYFLPQDFNYETEDSIRSKGIGQDRWQEWFSRIPARKSILMFDTCESGTLTGVTQLAQASRGGLEQITAVGRLIQATGRYMLTASMGDQAANEGYKNHGVFTYAVLEALARGDLSGNGRIEVLELMSYVDRVVPEITDREWGLRQTPQKSAQEATDFSLVKQLASLSPGGDDIIISTKPTHVVLDGVKVFATPNEGGNVVQELAPFSLVTLVKTQDGWVLIAREGTPLGFVAQSALRPVH